MSAPTRAARARSTPNAQRVLITGASGFLGTHVVDLLEERGAEVHVLKRHGSKIRRASPASITPHALPERAGDLAALVTEINPHTVYHLAAVGAVWPTGEGIHALVKANIEFGLEIIDGLRALNTVPTFVHALSYSSFGSNGEAEPNTPYAASKLAFELLAQSLTVDGSVQQRGVVLYDVYGPGDWRKKLLPDLVHAAVHNSEVTLSSGDQLMAPMFVDDVAEGLLAVGTASTSDTTLSRTTLGPSDVLSVRELVHEFERANDVTLRLEWGARAPNAPPKNIERLPFPGAPDWTPRVSLHDGLRRCLDEARRPLTVSQS